MLTRKKHDAMPFAKKGALTRSPRGNNKPPSIVWIVSEYFFWEKPFGWQFVALK